MFNTPFLLFFTLLLTLPLLFHFSPKILPQRRLTISISDDLHDLALFRRAFLSSVHPPGSISSKPKIAFLFLTNSDLHFAPLWETFFNPPISNSKLKSKSKQRKLYNIYVHADPDSDVNPPGGVFENRFIPAKKTQRSSPTLISAVRRLLATAIIDDPSNAYFAVVSQHCIPLHSFRYVYETLFKFQFQFQPSTTESTRGFPSQFLSRLSLSPSRRLSYIEVLSEEPQLWDRYIARGKNVMLPEVQFDEFRVGSQFFVLTRAHSLLVVKDRRLWRKFRLPCLDADTCYPEEHYFPTLLSMEDPNGVSGYTLTRVNWTDSVGGHPHTYGPLDVSSELIRSLRVSNSSLPYLFGRKFSPECLPALMDMGENVIFRG